MKSTPASRADGRLSNLVLADERSKCYRPKDHQGEHGDPLTQDEDDERILFGRCGASPMPTRIMNAGGRRPS